MKITFQHIVALTNVLLIAVILFQINQSSVWRDEFKNSIEQLTIETQRNLAALQSRLEGKVNGLNESLDTYQNNTNRSLRILEQRVENIERRPAVIMNGYQGYKNSGNQNNNIQ